MYNKDIGKQIKLMAVYQILVSLLFLTDFLFSQAHGTRKFKWENEFSKNFHGTQTDFFYIWKYMTDPIVQCILS